jgi:hypothetical protein
MNTSEWKIFPFLCHLPFPKYPYLTPASEELASERLPLLPLVIGVNSL